MIRRSTVVYIVLLLALAGAYLYLNNRNKTADLEVTAVPTSEATQAYLFTAEDGNPSSIRIDSQDGRVVELAREADNAWGLKQPLEVPAEQGAAEAAASQLSAMSILDTIPEIDPKVVGLDTPQYVLTVKFASGVERKVDIGVVTPTESGYYVRNTDNKVIIVSKSAVDSLLGLLDNPPYLETLTPNPATEPATIPNETNTPSP